MAPASDELILIMTTGHSLKTINRGEKVLGPERTPPRKIKSLYGLVIMVLIMTLNFLPLVSWLKENGTLYWLVCPDSAICKQAIFSDHQDLLKMFYSSVLFSANFSFDKCCGVKVVRKILHVVWKIPGGGTLSKCTV